MERVDRTVFGEAFWSPNLNASEPFGNQYICWIKYWNVRIDLGLNKSGCKKRGYCCHVGKSHCFMKRVSRRRQYLQAVVAVRTSN